MAKSKKNTPDLSVATVVDPVRLTTVKPSSRELDFSYFYNGKVVYSYCHQFPWHFQRFPELNPETVQATSWGIRDENYAVIGHQLIKVKPKRCRRIGKYAHFYFLIDEQVFSPNEVDGELALELVPDADARSFKVHDELYAEDANAYYRLGGRRIGSKTEDFPGVSSPDDLTPPVPKPAQQPKPDTWFPQIPDGNALERFECIQQWFDRDFSLKWQRHRSAPRLYQLLNFGLQLCCEISEDTNITMADRGIRLYERFKDYAWLMPELVHNAACLYAIQNKADLVASCCEEALGYRYENSDALLAEPVIKACLSAQVLQSLQQRAKALQPHTPYISLELIEAYEKVADEAKNDAVFSKMLERHILYTWLYYSADELHRLTAQENADQTYWKKLDEKIYWYMQNLMLLDFKFMVMPDVRQRIQSLIDVYYQHPYLSPVAIVSVAHDLFRMFHSETNWQETFLSEEGKRLPPSKRMLQSEALIKLFEKQLSELPQAQQQRYKAQAETYFAYLLMSSS